MRICLLAAFAVGALWAPEAALAGSGVASATGTPSANARVAFSIRIPGLLRLRTLRFPSHIEVPRAANAVVDVPEAVELEIQSNLRSGYELRFEIVDPDVIAVEVEGFGRRLTVTPRGVGIRMEPPTNPQRTRQHVLHYRVLFAEGARPGPRPVPVIYSLYSGI